MSSEIERLRKKVENYPSPSTYNRLAELLHETADYENLVRICTRAIHDFKHNSRAYVILAQYYLDIGKRPQATELLQTAIEQDPRSVDAPTLLANIYEAKGHVQGAQDCLRMILAIQPNNTDAQTRLERLAVPLNTKTQTIDMTAMPTSLGSTAETVAKNETDTSPFSFSPSPTVSASAAPHTPEPQQPAPPMRNPLAALMNEAGVQGVAIADSQGRVVKSVNMKNNTDAFLAALAHEVSNCNEETLAILGQSPMSTWSIITDKAQILAFRRNPNLTLLVYAHPQCKIAMIELRARQALIDLEGA